MKRISNLKHAQGGFSLMEAVVSIALSLVVTASMVGLMANSLGTTARIVNMTKLSDDLRNTMQLMTRDVRRTSYNANAMFCYGNDNCLSANEVTDAGEIFISDAGDCFTFKLDRNHDNYVGSPADVPAGGFRRVLDNGVGVIEMWTGDASPECDAEVGAERDPWVSVTNAGSMNITNFIVDDSLSYSELISDDGAGTIISQQVRKLRLAINAQLVSAAGVTREIEDTITVRNDLLVTERT